MTEAGIGENVMEGVLIVRPSNLARETCSSRNNDTPGSLVGPEVAPVSRLECCKGVSTFWMCLHPLYSLSIGGGSREPLEERLTADVESGHRMREEMSVPHERNGPLAV